MFKRVIIFICFLLKIISATESTVWEYHTVLDPHQKFSVKWNINADETSITFLCEVQTRGWIGFGLSPNGGMKNSDLIIAWVNDNDGVTHFKVLFLLFFSFHLNIY